MVFKLRVRQLDLDNKNNNKNTQQQTNKKPFKNLDRCASNQISC